METTQQIGAGLTFEKVWAAIQATNEQIKETGRIVKENAERIKETGRIVKENAERIKETDKQMKETAERIRETGRIVKENAERIKETDKQMKETAEQMKETDKRVGAITNRFGEMVEYMIAPNLVAKFDELDFTFTKANRTKITDRKNGIFVEVDAFLENGEEVMIVEIKAKPNTDDINDHIERMEKLRRYADLHGDKRKYLGAMAGVVFDEGVKTYTLKKGFYVIEPAGDTFKITEPKGKYHPRAW